MPNDLPLFAVTARSFAMGRSDAAVADAADEVLAGAEEDGFASKIVELAGSGWRLD
jgi:hydroxymethylpyrimidine pyrophosphatase-like HAD family hydrolase